MAEQIALPHQFLRLLRSDAEHNSMKIVTGNESWFLSEPSVTSGWSRSRDDLAARPTQNLQTEKHLGSLTSSPNPFHSGLAVPKGGYDNSTFLTNVVVPDLQTNLCSGTRWNSKRRIETASRPQFKTFLGNSGGKWRHQSAASSSPDMAPSCFDFFGDLKEKLQ
jgi:hypothetical protein